MNNSKVNEIELDYNHVQYIEYGNKKTYTFKILNSESSSFQNLVIIQFPDGTMQKRIITYSLSEQEKQDLLNGNMINFSGRISSIIPVGDYIPNSLGKYYESGGKCYTENVEVSPCGSGQHNSSNMDKWHECTHPKKAQVVLSVEEIDCPSGGGGSSGTGSGNIGEDPLDPNNGGIEFPTTPILSNMHFIRFINTLPQNLQNIINNEDNLDYYTGLNNYFYYNNKSDEAKIFINWAIQFKADNPSTTWEQFQNWFLDPRIDIDNTLNNTLTLCVLSKISGDTQPNDSFITLPTNSINDNFVQKMLRSFNGVNTPNLTFHISPTLSNNDWGQTSGSTTNNYNIYISSSIENGSNLMKFITLSHELVHAYMFFSLYSAGVVTFNANGDPLANVNCYPNINYNGLINLNNLTAAERFLVLFCLMNQNGTLTSQWTHEFFNTPSIDANIYQQKIEDYLLSSYDWDSENTTFKNEAINVFGNNWKQELAKAISWIGLEQTSDYNSYISGYQSSPNKLLYISAIRNKIQNSNKNCP